MVICPYCDSEFTVNRKGSGGTNRSACFSCMPEGLSREQRYRVLRTLNNARSRKCKKDLGCSVCGYAKNASALEWHHPTSVKEAHPTDALKRGWQAYQNEIMGCVLLCANCHREVHFPES
jgi:hypothetical protein